jgi:hypothetical protein
MDSNATESIELEERLRTHYERVYGEPASSAEVWAAIAGRLDEQESRQTVEFARGMSELHSTDGHAVQRASSPGRQVVPRRDAALVPRLRSVWSPALAAGLLLGLVAVLVVLLAVAGSVNQARVARPAPTAFDFENGLGTWKFTSTNRDVRGNDEYKGGVDTDTAHSGIASAYIATSNDAEQAEPVATGELNASILADPYRGERVRLSGYVKTTSTLWAVMNMGVGGKEVETGRGRSKSPVVLAGDTMLDRPILSTGGQSDWQRYEIVLDVPAEAVTLYFGLSMAGKGQIWLDDVVVEAVGDDVPTTDMYNRKEPGNLDFEDGLSFWSASPSQWKFKMGWVTDIVYSGRSAGYLDTTAGRQAVEPDASLYQTVNAEQYRGSRVRFSAYIKTQGAEVEAIPYLVVSGNPFAELTLDNLRDDPLVGTSDWTKYELTVDVPEEAYQISFGLSMAGAGKLWIDEVRLEREELPAGVLEHIDLENAGFENGLAPWIKSSQPYQTNFSVDVDRGVVHSGNASALIKSNREDAKGNGMLSWSIDAAAYQGKRVRWTGYLRSETITTGTAEGRAGLWMNVNGSMLGFDPGQTAMLALDNMMDRPVIGTTDWQRYEVVLDVPPGAERIAFGAALDGPGKVWVDDVRLEVVSMNVPTTEYYRGTATQFENPDFENGLVGWRKYSQRFTAYEAGTDENIKHGGKASGYLKAEQSNLEVPGEIGQKIHADEYRGQRVRLTVYIMTADVAKGAGIGMGSLLPDGSQGPYDDMTTRLITGTNDWQKVEVVLDVPPDATTLTVGAFLYGPGQMWVDDLQFEVVGKDVPLTSPGQ